MPTSVDFPPTYYTSIFLQSNLNLLSTIYLKLKKSGFISFSMIIQRIIDFFLNQLSKYGAQFSKKNFSSLSYFSQNLSGHSFLNIFEPAVQNIFHILNFWFYSLILFPISMLLELLLSILFCIALSCIQYIYEFEMKTMSLGGKVKRKCLLNILETQILVRFHVSFFLFFFANMLID